jgi:signal transduction histidine kinase
MFISALLTEIKPLLKKGQVIQHQHHGKQDFILDTTLLKNILLNLISNAIKFSPEFAPIVIITSIDGDELNIQVTDHGIGIPLEDQEHLMDRFYRASNAVNIQGTGLGLYIVSKYVESMNGTMHYQSTHEQGTTFYLNFHCLNLTNNENHPID